MVKKNQQRSGASWWFSEAEFWAKSSSKGWKVSGFMANSCWQRGDRRAEWRQVISQHRTSVCNLGTSTSQSRSAALPPPFLQQPGWMVEAVCLTLSTTFKINADNDNGKGRSLAKTAEEMFDFSFRQKFCSPRWNTWSHYLPINPNGLIYSLVLWETEGHQRCS